MDKVPEIVGKTLDQLSQRFGATGQALLSAYVHWVMMDALANLAGILVFGGIILYALRRYRKSNTWKGAEDVLDFVEFVATCILGIGFALAVACNLATILAPQGAALYMLMHHA